jgi:acetyl-CoA acetyltransferase
LASEVQERYRAIVNECLQQQTARALIVGGASVDAFYHLALRDALRAMSVAGVPPRFRIALVAETPDLIAIYDAAVMEAERCGIEARRFQTAEEAERWLNE